MMCPAPRNANIDRKLATAEGNWRFILIAFSRIKVTAKGQ